MVGHIRASCPTHTPLDHHRRDNPDLVVVLDSAARCCQAIVDCVCVCDCNACMHSTTANNLIIFKFNPKWLCPPAYPPACVRSPGGHARARVRVCVSVLACHFPIPWPQCCGAMRRTHTLRHPPHWLTGHHHHHCTIAQDWLNIVFHQIRTPCVCVCVCERVSESNPLHANKIIWVGGWPRCMVHETAMSRSTPFNSLWCGCTFSCSCCRPHRCCCCWGSGILSS